MNYLLYRENFHDSGKLIYKYSGQNKKCKKTFPDSQNLQTFSSVEDSQYMVYERSNQKCKPATPLDLFLDHYLTIMEAKENKKRIEHNYTIYYRRLLWLHTCAAWITLPVCFIRVFVIFTKLKNFDRYKILWLHYNYAWAFKVISYSLTTRH